MRLQLLALSSLAACGVEPAGPDMPELRPPVACGAVLPGPPLSSLESEPDYAQQVAALDLAAVADPYDYSAEIALTRGLVNYMLGRAEGTIVTRADFAAAGPLGDAVRAAITITGGRSIDLPFLRRGLYHAYNCSSTFPATLDELELRFGDTETWPSVIQDCAAPKGLPRRVRSHAEYGVYVAETLDGSQVREVEVIFTHTRPASGLDFAVYGPDGALTDRSTFATVDQSKVVGAAPFTCLTCHVDRDSWTFSIQRPVGTGAGCR